MTETRLFMLLDADLSVKVLQDSLNHAANVGRPGGVFDVAITLRLVCKDWATNVKPLMNAKMGLLLRELSQLEGLEDISEDNLRQSTVLDLSAAFEGAEVDTHRVNMLLAVVHTNRGLEKVKLKTRSLPIKQLNGVEAIGTIHLCNAGLCSVDACMIGSLIKGNGEAMANFPRVPH